MEERLKLSKECCVPKEVATCYRSIVGGLQYLMHTRSNIAFVLGYVSRFLEDPRADHLAVIKHLLRYIAGTCYYRLV